MSLLIFIEKKQEARAVEEKFEKANDNNTCDEQRAHKTQWNKWCQKKNPFLHTNYARKKNTGWKEVNNNNNAISSKP